MLESDGAEISVHSRSQHSYTQCSGRKLVRRREVGLRAQRRTYPGLPRQIHEMARHTDALQVSPASCQLQEQTTVNPQLCHNKDGDSRFLGKNYFRLDRSASHVTAGSGVTFKPNLHLFQLLTIKYAVYIQSCHQKQPQNCPCLA